MLDLDAVIGPLRQPAVIGFALAASTLSAAATVILGFAARRASAGFFAALVASDQRLAGSLGTPERLHSCGWIGPSHVSYVRARRRYLSERRYDVLDDRGLQRAGRLARRLSQTSEVVFIVFLLTLFFCLALLN